MANMEELHDAIEDAQYVNAINVHEGPRPIKGWPVVTEDEMGEWKCDLMQKWEQDPNKTEHNEPFGFFWTLASPLGFFMFSCYLKDIAREYSKINFLEDVLRWRKLLGQESNEALKEIVTKYLLPCQINHETDQLCLPLTAINPLMYKPIGNLLSAEKLANFLEKNMISDSEKSCIGLDGRVRERILLSYRSDKSFSTTKKLNVLEKNGEREPLRTFIASKKSEVKKGHVKYFTEDTEVSSTRSDRSSPTTKKSNILEKNSETKHCTKDAREFVASNGQVEELEKGEAKTGEQPISQVRTTEEIEDGDGNKNQKQKICCLGDDIFNVAVQIVLEYLRLKHWRNFTNGKTEHWSKLIKLLWNNDRPVVAEDFFPMRVLGRGGFGLVTACKRITTGKLYAMKVMKKKRIKLRKSQHLALNERAVLAAVDSPFVISLKYAFETKSDVYLIMDLMTGGDLSFHLNEKGFFSKRECLYYAARIILGLQALHDRGYVYRDLKPENCLLAEDGRVRLTDLGLTTKIHNNLNGAAGTRGYWAPEMLEKDNNGRRSSYDHRVDWFSFGCVVAEMISGVNPFRSESALNFSRGFLGKGLTKDKAVDYATLEFEPTFHRKLFDEPASDLCSQLLSKDPNKRLGRQGHEEIMRHPWFYNIDWDMVISDSEKPPFLPLKDINAGSQSEIGNFERSGVKLDKKDECYKDWDWVNPNAFAEEVMEMLIYERESGKPLTLMSDYNSCCCTIV